MPQLKGWPYNWQGVSKLTPLETWLELSQIGLRWLNGVLHKGRTLLSPSPLLLKTLNRVLLLTPLRKIFIYDFGSHVSVLCPARCDFSVSRSDVSGRLQAAAAELKSVVQTYAADASKSDEAERLMNI